MNKICSIEIQNGFINMLLDKIVSLGAEIAKFNNLMNNIAHIGDAEQQLRNNVSRTKQMLFGNEY